MTLTHRAGAPFEQLSDAVARLVEPGMHLHFASTPSRSNAAVRAVARAFRGHDPRFTLSTSGFHSTAHLLALLRLGARYLACFFGDNYPAPRPNPLYTAIAAEGASIEHWSLLSYVSALRAGALGHEWAVTGSLAETSLGAELAAAGRFVEIPDPARPGARIGLVRAIRPDLTFVHAAVADERGNVFSCAPHGEGAWSALAARHGVVVTVEQRVEGDLSRRHADLALVPPHRIRAICVEPFGAHPQPLYSTASLGERGYSDHFEHYEMWRDIASEPEAHAELLEQLLGGATPDDGAERYRAFAGARRLARLATPVRGVPVRGLSGHGVPVTITADGSRRLAAATPPPAPAIDRLVLTATRQIVARVRQGGHKLVLAGIGQGFLAARLARALLAREQREVAVLVETGLYDLDCGPAASHFLLAWDNIAGARRLTDIEDVLGALVCGAGADCLGVLGAAQIDRAGNLNSTRLADGRCLVGSGGASDVAASAAEVVAVVQAAPGRLVDRVDYVTSPGTKVRSVVTDLGVLERSAGGRSDGWRVTQLVPPAGKSAAEALALLRSRCPWPLELPDVLPVAEPPSREELELLVQLDPDGQGRTRARLSPGAGAGAGVTSREGDRGNA